MNGMNFNPLIPELPWTAPIDEENRLALDRVKSIKSLS